jgi:hypothetical protein
MNSLEYQFITSGCGLQWGGRNSAFLDTEEWLEKISFEDPV